jgi:tetratricopeptide (TPR) repeat protein
VHKEGERLMLDAELSAADGTRLWGNRYESDAITPQRAQESLIADLARHFGHSTSSQPLVRRTTDDPEAYRLYLRARYAWNKRDGQSILRSIALFNQAIDRDPTFALAYSGLADAYAIVGTLASLSARDTFSKAKAAAVKAVEIDDSIAEAHTSLAYVKHYWDHDWTGAEEEYRRAIALNPNYATAHQWYSELLSALGRHQEARREIDRAVELDPLSPMIPAMRVLTSYFARDYPGAIAVGKKCIADFPDFVQSWAYLGRAYTENGNRRESIDALTRAMPPPDNAAAPIIDAWLAHAYARAGQTDKTRAAAGRLRKIGERMNPYYLSYPFIDLGRRDEALTALEKASEDRVEQLVWLKVDPVLDPLRGEPRFQQILARAGFR